MSLTVGANGELDARLLGVACDCGRTLLSTSRRGLSAQLGSHWRGAHSERIVISADEFIGRNAFEVWEVD